MPRFETTKKGYTDKLTNINLKAAYPWFLRDCQIKDNNQSSLTGSYSIPVKSKEEE